MRDPRIAFGVPGAAAVFALLFPGAGHFYQGRRLKGGIFAVCILSTFLTGLVLGNGQPVYSQVVHVRGGGMQGAQLHTGHLVTERSLGYYLQFFVGLPAAPALVQSWRHGAPTNRPGDVTNGLSAPYAGSVVLNTSEGQQRMVHVEGVLTLNSSEEGGGGQLEFQDPVGNPMTVKIPPGSRGNLRLGRPVFGAPQRDVAATVESEDGATRGSMSGAIPRAFLNWFQAPRDNRELDRLHGELSQRFDIGCVFTWIAGLLNIMVIWDAYDGPAFGYGDEPEDDGSDAKDDDA